MDAIDPNFLYDKFRSWQKDLTRSQSSMLFQIRSNHLPLNVYLHRIGKTESRNCSNCASNGQEIEETVTHYLFECPSFDYERHTLDTNLGPNSRDLRTILEDKEMMSELLKFIGCTKRLQSSLGDVSTSCSNTTDR